MPVLNLVVAVLRDRLLLLSLLVERFVLTLINEDYYYYYYNETDYTVLSDVRKLVISWFLLLKNQQVSKMSIYVAHCHINL